MADVSLFAPSVHFESSPESQFDAMMSWRAELLLAYLDEDDCPDVVAGYADFLTIRLHEHPIADLLDSLSADAAHFAPLFAADEVSDVVADQFSAALPFHRVLIVSSVYVAEPLRGHDLGAWLVSEVIARMAGTTDTLVLLYPFPTIAQTADPSELAAVDKLVEFWQRVGLVPIVSHPEFLGQSTAYTSLPAARESLGAVEDVTVAVPAWTINTEPPPTYPRDTLLRDRHDSDAP